MQAEHFSNVLDATRPAALPPAVPKILGASLSKGAAFKLHTLANAARQPET
jgi:hypothetical protein